MMRSKRGLCQVNILANATIANAQGQPNQYPNVNVNQNYSHRSSTMDDKCNWQRDVGSKGGIQSFKSGNSVQKMIFISSVRSSTGYHGLLHIRSTHFFKFFKFFRFESESESERTQHVLYF